MRIIVLLVICVSIPVFAGQCPNLTGTYICKDASGTTTMVFTQSGTNYYNDGKLFLSADNIVYDRADRVPNYYVNGQQQSHCENSILKSTLKTTMYNVENNSVVQYTEVSSEYSKDSQGNLVESFSGFITAEENVVTPFSSQQTCLVKK